MALLLHNIAIVGGGLSGLSLALHLKQHGINSTIYEFRPATYSEGGSIVLLPNGLRALDHINVYKAIALRGYNSENTLVLNGSGKYLGSLAQGSVYGYPALRIQRKFVREELLKEVANQGIKVIYEKRFERLEEIEGGTKLVFEDGQTTNASLVIGADGIRSRVREHISASVKLHYVGIVIYGVVSRHVLEEYVDTTERLATPCVLSGKEGSFTIWPRDYKADEVGYLVNIEIPDRTKEEWRKLEADGEAVRKILTSRFCGSGYPQEIEILCQITRGNDFLIWPVNMIPPLSSWKSSSGKVIIMGDAAHAIPPSAAQGGSLALEDAETLAFTLAKCTSDPSQFQLWLQKWEEQRKNRIDSVIKFTKLSARLRAPTSSWILQWLKEWTIRILFRIKGRSGYSWLYGWDGSATAKL